MKDVSIVTIEEVVSSVIRPLQKEEKYGLAEAYCLLCDMIGAGMDLVFADVGTMVFWEEDEEEEIVRRRIVVADHDTIRVLLNALDAFYLAPDVSAHVEDDELERISDLISDAFEANGWLFSSVPFAGRYLSQDEILASFMIGLGFEDEAEYRFAFGLLGSRSSADICALIVAALALKPELGKDMRLWEMAQIGGEA